MIIIDHRRNTIQELKNTPVHLGIEMDIRSYGSKLVVHHDPFVEGESFSDWLNEYKHAFLILNVKEEGLEASVLKEVFGRGIKDFFFLDQSFPFLVKTVWGGESRCALRVSEFESIETVLSLSGQVGWVWIDCFTKFPLDSIQYESLKEGGFKTCLVSPELQGRDADKEIPEMRKMLDSKQIIIDAVCTKFPKLWN